MNLRKYAAMLGLAFVVLSFQSLSAQTIIDLKRGGTVRAKTVEDYREEAKIKERLAADSLAYIDHLTRALNALGRDSLAQAEALFKEALRVRPDAPSNYVVRQNLGEIYLTQGRYREAIARFGEVLKEHPEAGDARYERAVGYYEMGNQQAALEDCTVLLNGSPITPLRVKALFLRAGIHMKTNSRIWLKRMWKKSSGLTRKTKTAACLRRAFSKRSDNRITPYTSWMLLWRRIRRIWTDGWRVPNWRCACFCPIWR